MIKKLLLTFCFVTLITITFNGTTYAAQEGETIVTSEELSNTIIILNNLYKDGVLTEEEYLNAKSAILNPASVSDGKIEKKSKQLTVVERKRLKEAKGCQNVRMTTADTEAAFDETHRTLATERYDRSETDAAEICVLNDGAALLTAHFTRYRTDDSVLTNGASAYLFGKFDDGWRIVAIIANPAAKLIACD